INADVCIVGAGIAGMTTAYLLAREGRSVVILDKSQIGSGETAHTTAHLSSVIDAGYREIEVLHGTKGAQLVAQSHTAAIAQIESIVAEEKIDCDFERSDGYLCFPVRDFHKKFQEEWRAVKRAGLHVRKLKQSPFDLNFGPCLHFPQQAQFHPLKYLAGLARAIKRLDGRLFGGTEAKEIKGGKTVKIGTKGRAIVSAGLTLDRAGILYGTTTEGLLGTVFQLKRTDGSWILNTLNGFGVNQQDARFPLGRVVFGPDGTLYGTTLYGGSGHCSGGCGTVYNLRPPATDCKTVVCPWTRTVLYSFTGGPDGIGPYYVDPVFRPGGNFYGTSGFGSPRGDGAVFKLTPSGGGWKESVIHSFTGDGMEPESGVIFDSAGNLYGTTAFGGRYDQGTIYQLTPSGSGWNAR